MKNFGGGDMFIMILIGLVIGVFTSIGLTSCQEGTRKQRVQDRAVESGLGHYDAKTGDWEWNTPKLQYTITGSKTE